MLQHIIGKDNFIAPQFLGVFSSDTLPPINRLSSGSAGCSLIVNTKKQGMPNGGHWITLFKKDGDHLEIFDSLGQNDYSFLTSLASQFKHVLCQDYQLQSNCAQTCGFYALFFLHKRCRGYSYSSICNLFSKTNTMQNDQFVFQAVMQKMVI